MTADTLTLVNQDRESKLSDPISSNGDLIHSLLGWVGIPSGLALLGILAQETLNWENIQNVTGLVAIIIVAVFLVVKFVPSIQDHNIKMTAEYSATIKQVSDNHAAIVTKIQEQHAVVIRDMSEEHATLLKSIVMDHKESLKHITDQLVQEKRLQRDSMQASFDVQIQRIISLLTQGKVDIGLPKKEPKKDLTAGE